MKKLLGIVILIFSWCNVSYSEMTITTYKCKEVLTYVDEDKTLSVMYRNKKAATLITKIEEIYSQDKWGSPVYGTATLIEGNYQNEYILNYSEGYGRSFKAYQVQKIDNEFINTEKDDYRKKIWKKNKGKIYSASFLTFENEPNNNDFFELDKTFTSLWTLETDINQVSGSNTHFKCTE